MTSRVIVCDQRSDEWFAARCGRLTSTGAKAVVTKGRNKGEEAVARRDLKLQLVVERLTGKPAEDAYQSPWMKRGIETEAEAFAAYETRTGALVRRVGFLASDDVRAGCSPDGIIGSSGLLEIKCPKMATHLRYLTAGTVPLEYVPQILHALWISQAEWCDFVSYEPNFPPELRLFVVRVAADHSFPVSKTDSLSVESYAAAALTFLTEVEEQELDVRALVEKAGAA